MKRLAIAWGLLFAVVSLGWLGQFYLHSSTQHLEEQTSQAQQWGENELWDTAYQTCENLRGDWEKTHDILCLFVDHGMLENIEKEVALLPQLCIDRDLTELNRHCVLLKMYTEHLVQSETLSWKNVL